MRVDSRRTLPGQLSGFSANLLKTKADSCPRTLLRTLHRRNLRELAEVLAESITYKGGQVVRILSGHSGGHLPPSLEGGVRHVRPPDKMS